MASGLDIRLGEEVSSIAYDGNGVSVTSTSGVETGSHVVVTVPLAILTEIFGAAPPPPTAVRTTRWLSDPFSLGSYSHIPVGASPSDMDALAAPVGGRVLFAGEATNSDYYATVHGAMLSGIREGKRLLQQSTVTLPEPGGLWPLLVGAAGVALMDRWHRGRSQTDSTASSGDHADWA